jgi:polyamine oxidase
VSENPIFNIAVEQLQLDGTIDEYDTNTYVFRDCATGTDKTEEGRHAKDEFDEKFEEICANEKPLSTHSSTTEDTTIRLALEEVGWKGPKSTIDAAVEWLVVDFELGDSADKASFAHNIKGEYTQDHFGETDYLISDKRGFSSVIDHMAKGLKENCIKTSQIVTTINTSNSSVHVTTTTGQVFRSKDVLVTASIGVLQSGLIKFEPELPKWKIAAIEDLKMTTYVKVFVMWEKRWWDDLAENNDSTVERNLYTVLLDEN